MNQSDGITPPESLANLTDREIWRLSRAIEMAEDDAAFLLDLAGFADGLLDPDDQERVAEWLARPEAAADVSAARGGSGLSGLDDPVPDAVVARAAMLVGASASAAHNVVPFPPKRGRGASLPELARWGSLAAAVVLASWLGFTMGVDMSGSLAGTRNGDVGLNELLDPAASLIRDLTDGTQT